MTENLTPEERYLYEYNEAIRLTLAEQNGFHPIEVKQEVIENVIHDRIKLRYILAKLQGVDQYDTIFERFFNN